MNTFQALEALREGKKVRVCGWNSGLHLFRTGDNQVAWSTNGMLYSMGSLLNDHWDAVWEIYEPKEIIKALGVLFSNLVDGNHIEQRDKKDKIICYYRYSLGFFQHNIPGSMRGWEDSSGYAIFDLGKYNYYVEKQ